MGAVKVRWTRLAIEDLDHAHDYIAARSPAGARAVIERVESALKALKSHPEMGRPGRVEGTRELVIPGTPFIVAYRPFKKRLDILAFIHGARRWPERF